MGYHPGGCGQHHGRPASPAYGPPMQNNPIEPTPNPTTNLTPAAGYLTIAQALERSRDRGVSSTDILQAAVAGAFPDARRFAGPGNWHIPEEALTTWLDSRP